MWETLSIPLTVVGSAFLATFADALVPGCAPLLFFGLVVALPRLWQAPVVSVLLVTGVTSVVALCASLPRAGSRAADGMRLSAIASFVALTMVGAMLSMWVDQRHTLVFVVFITMLWLFTVIKGARPAPQDAGVASEARWQRIAVAAGASLAGGATGFGLRPMTDAQGKFLGEPVVFFAPRALFATALVIAAAKALLGQTPPILAAGAALGAFPGLLARSRARRILKPR
jgi:hypothetical protein